MDEGRGGERDRGRHAPRRDRGPRLQARPAKTLIPSSGTPRGCGRSSSACSSLDLPVDEWAKEEGIADEELLSRIERRADEHMAAKVAQWGADVMRYVEKIDPAADARPSLARTPGHARAPAPGDRLARLWPARSAQRVQGGSRSICSRRMSTSLREAVTSQLMRVEIRTAPPEEHGEPALHGGAQDRSVDRRGRDGDGRRAGAETLARHGITAGSPRPERNPNDPTSWGKVGRNEACPCGSGKKYKHCHGRFA